MNHNPPSRLLKRLSATRWSAFVVSAARRPFVVATVLGTLALAVYIGMSAEQWRRMQTPSWDLAIFTQAAKQYASLSAPVVDIKGPGFNLLGDHFHPILAFLGPLYAVWPSGMTVLVVQDVLLAVSVGIFAWFGTRFLGGARGACLGFGFAVSFGVLEAVRVQFHEVAFAIPLTSMALCSLAVGKFRTATWWALPLVFVKEDLGVSAAVIGAVIVLRVVRTGTSGPSAALRRRTLVAGRARWGCGLVLWGLSWSALAVFVVLPGLNPEGRFAYGGAVDAWGAVADPLQSFGLMFYPWAKTTTWAILLLTGALVFLRSPVVWVGVPTLVWRFLSDNSGYWETTWHYNLVLMPVVFAALFDAALKARPVRGGSLRRSVERVTAFGPVLAAVVGLLLVPTSALAAAVDTARSPLPQNIGAKKQALDVVPDGATVASDLSVLTYLVPRHDVQWIGTTGDPAPEYVVLDRLSSTWAATGSPDPEHFARQSYGTDYTTTAEDRGIVVLARAQ